MRWSSSRPRTTRDSSFKYSSYLLSIKLMIGCQLHVGGVRENVEKGGLKLHLYMYQAIKKMENY